ncbi:hypothetical protein [Paracoccus sp. (in: a-proteobacteria)]|uniref:helix-turn-helix transcriptional regulator n=1 Tax=Paracoccus sp. TaxID=267 RepID=UPI0032209EC5
MTGLELLRLHDVRVAILLGSRRSTVWNRMRAGRFPTPIKWEGLTVWRRKDCEAFVDGMAGQVAGCSTG